MGEPAVRVAGRGRALALAAAVALGAGCTGAGTGSPAATVGADAGAPAMTDPRAAADPSSTGSAAADPAAVLVPGRSRDEVLGRLAALGAAETDCRSTKVAAPGTGRAFLHERCRVEPGAGASARAAGPLPALRAARVDLVDGAAVRADLHLSRAPSDAERGTLRSLAGDGARLEILERAPGAVAVLIDGRLESAFPALATEPPGPS